MQFFYDNQIERYLLQFMRIFSDISVKTGPDENGTYELKRIPIVNGQMSRHIAAIIKGNSENTLIPTPLFSAYIKDIDLNPKRRQDPSHVSPVSRTEREFTNGAYTQNAGNKIMVERHMPVPYDITFALDVLVSNQQSKLQILEQILTIFNPALQLQQNSNAIDWSRLFEVELTKVNWTNNNIPIGADDGKEIASLTFMSQIWINPPAKVKQTRRITQIVNNVNSVANIPSVDALRDTYDPFSEFSTLTQIVTTPGNHKVSIGINGYSNNQLLLLNSHGVTSNTLSWANLLEKYQGIKDTTQIVLRLSNNIEDDSMDIYGNISLVDGSPNLLNYLIDQDTLPASSININKIIDPRKELPGRSLPVAEVNQKYLIISEFSENEEYAITTDSLWNINANEGDIISYNGTNWEILFDTTNSVEGTIIFNEDDSNLYQFNNSEWEYVYVGEYSPGYWFIKQTTGEITRDSLC
jgi:hypothetical protein